jgi:hypothetical protein
MPEHPKIQRRSVALTSAAPRSIGTRAARGGRARFLDRDLAADFDNLIARQVEVIRHVGDSTPSAAAGVAPPVRSSTVLSV